MRSCPYANALLSVQSQRAVTTPAATVGDQVAVTTSTAFAAVESVLLPPTKIMLAGQVAVLLPVASCVSVSVKFPLLLGAVKVVLTVMRIDWLGLLASVTAAASVSTVGLPPRPSMAVVSATLSGPLPASKLVSQGMVSFPVRGKVAGEADAIGIPLVNIPDMVDS